MDYRVETPRRKVIPNWRYYNNTVNLGELTSFENVNLSDADLYPIDDYISDWIDSKSVYRASDLISAAITNSQKNNSHIIEAAKFLLSKQDKINLVQKQTAEYILDNNNNVECDKNVLRLKNVAIDKLKTASETHNKIHALRLYAHAYPFNPIVYVDMARAYVTIGLKEKAEKLIRMALYLDPKNRFVARAAARFYIHIGDNERAADIVRKTGFSRFDPWLMASDISIAMMRGKRSGNIKKGQQMIFSSSYTPFSISELASALGTVEMEYGTRKKTRDLFNQSLVDPNDNSLAQAEWALLSARIPITIQSGLNVKCSHESKVYKALELNDARESIHHAIDWICDMPFSLKPVFIGYEISTSFLRDYDLSSNILGVGLKSHPNDPWMLNNRAYVNARINKLDEAEKDMEQLEHCNRVLSESMSVCKEATHGLIAYRRKDREKGRKLYEQAILHASAMKENSEEVKVKAQINMLREEIIFSNYQNTSALMELEQLVIPNDKLELVKLRNEVFDEMKKNEKNQG